MRALSHWGTAGLCGGWMLCSARPSSMIVRGETPLAQSARNDDVAAAKGGITTRRKQASNQSPLIGLSNAIGAPVPLRRTPETRVVGLRWPETHTCGRWRGGQQCASCSSPSRPRRWRRAEVRLRFEPVATPQGVRAVLLARHWRSNGSLWPVLFRGDPVANT